MSRSSLVYPSTLKGVESLFSSKGELTVVSVHPLDLKMEVDRHCSTVGGKGTVSSQSLSTDFVRPIYSKFRVLYYVCTGPKSFFSK